MNTLITARLDAIRDHLDAHPDLPAPALVDFTMFRPDPVVVGLSSYQLAPAAAALLVWAATLTDVSVNAWRAGQGKSVHLRLLGALADGTPVKVYDPVPFDAAVFLDLEPGGTQNVGMTVLRSWAAHDMGRAA